MKASRGQSSTCASTSCPSGPRSRDLDRALANSPPIRIVRIIARLNVGGPSIQAITLTRRLEPLGYATTLVRGQEAEREGTMDHLAAALDVHPVHIAALRRDPGWHDVRALVELIRLLRRERPQVVHTHAAKAGTLGRIAALLAFPRQRPVLVHTFHGHSLTGYFSSRTAAVYRRIEQLLACFTDRLVAVSDQVRDELVELGVACRRRFTVIPLGFDLSPFSVSAEVRERSRAAVRAELDIPQDATVVTLIARLVPIKRVDRFLRAVQQLANLESTHFLILGDGELGNVLRASPEAHAARARLVWAGFRNDIPAVCFASDVVVLCSDNEGTPVSLIEAAASGLPTISTRVGGAASVVLDGETGLLVERDDGAALAAAIRELIGDRALRRQLGEAARDHALRSFSLDRLIADLDELYRCLLTERL